MAKGKGGESQTVTSRPDAATRRYTADYRNRAGDFANDAANFEGGSFIPGANPLTTDAAGNFRGLGGAGNLGLTGLGLGLGGLAGMAGGDISKYYDPYESQVISGVQGDYDRMRQISAMNANQQATQAGAFGGSRHAVLDSLNQDNINRAEGSQLAGLRSQGFNDAWGRGIGVNSQLANLGLGAGGLGLGASGAMNQAGWQLHGLDASKLGEAWNRRMQGMGVMQTGLAGGGTTTTQPMQGGNMFQNMLGGAGVGAKFGPWGAAAGAGAGLLGGWLF